MSKIIEVQGFKKTFNSFVAVDDISFSVNSGEVFGFIGPNGAGKTTTIRMLTGLSKASSSKASILNYDVQSEITKIKKRIGVVPEASNLYDELSGVDNLVFMAQLFGIARNERIKRAEGLLKTFNLYERKDSLFRTYSRGMKRALTIAAALIHKPSVIFLDEPTTGLDVVAARSLRNLIKNLRSQGMTIFLTSHYLEEADLLCDRIAVIVKGKIIKIDTPQALKESTNTGSLEDAFIKITGLSPTVMVMEKGGGYNVAR